MLVPCRIVLVGMMGSGKTAVGTALARRTGWPFHDNDQLLEEATGRTAREIATDGEPALRSAESAALRLAVGRPEPSIVAIAGGAVLDPTDRARLTVSGIVVWLRADPAVLAERSRTGAHRPWIDTDAEAWLSEAAQVRDPLYRSIAAHVFDSATATPDRLAEQLLTLLDGSHCVRHLPP